MSDDPKPFHNPFEALRARRDELPRGSASKEAAPERIKSPARAVVRMERKGRAGKEVTIVDQLGLSADGLEAWLKELRSALGCGGVAEGGKLVLQGDHRRRLRVILQARGVGKVIVG